MPLLEGIGDVGAPVTQSPRPALCLLPGDLALSVAEDEFSSQWPLCLDGNVRSFRVVSAFSRILQMAHVASEAELVLIDVGPNLGAINRAALIAADFVVVPLAPDLFSLQGLRNLGPTLREWRNGWEQRLRLAGDIPGLADLKLPTGKMAPMGYVVQEHAVSFDRPVRAHARWMDAIPNEYREAMLHEPDDDDAGDVAVTVDEYCLGTLKSYRSLMPYAQDARKPMFCLRAADGAIGGHVNAVQDCYRDFRDLACAIAQRCGVRCPQLD